MASKKSIFLSFIAILLFLLASSAAWIYSRINGALPILEGNKTIYGLQDNVKIDRDEAGIATITAQSRQDAAAALGFVHAQERFFQMDLLRRNAAGELSSLFGPAALSYDKKIRLHRFRDRARDIVKQLSTTESALLKAYTRGVNQGLNRLYSSPLEYLLLQQEPVLWQEEDSILTVFSMYLDLQHGHGEREISLGILEKSFPAHIVKFLAPKGSQWDATLDGSEFAPSPMPTEPWPAISSQNSAQFIDDKLLKSIDAYGSNNWAVSGSISKTQSAIVANDMHLGLRVPNTWYRAQLIYQHQGETLTVTGATLPGTPNIVIGSNTNIAWGFTNSYGDWSDVIVLKTNKRQSKYLTPEGYKPFNMVKQMIAVKGEPSVKVTIKETQWGPVIGKDSDGNLLAYRWVAHDKNAVNLTLLDMELAQSVDDAFKVATKAGIPAQNLMVGDKAGNIGWTIMGPIPSKFGQLGETPKDWSAGEFGWQGYLSYEHYPRVKNPQHERLWTANSRVIGGEQYQVIGNGGYALGARAKQIKQRLFEHQEFDEQTLLSIALDTEARFMSRWQQFLLTEVLTEQQRSAHPNWQQVYEILNNNKLAADTDSVAYRIVRTFRKNVLNAVFKDFNQFLTQKDSSFDIGTIRARLEVPLWQLITRQPDNFMWLPADSWPQLFEQALSDTLTSMTKEETLAQATWGKENAAKIHHPLSKAVPLLDWFFDMPNDPLPGDTFIPRVDGGTFGASERMVVSPGHEQQGIFHMPTSQASHPWSPYFGVGHQDWVSGKPSAFLPGKTKYELTLLSY